MNCPCISSLKECDATARGYTTLGQPPRCRPSLGAGGGTAQSNEIARRVRNCQDSSMKQMQLAALQAKFEQAEGAAEEIKDELVRIFQSSTSNDKRRIKKFLSDSTTLRGDLETSSSVVDAAVKIANGVSRYTFRTGARAKVTSQNSYKR